MKLPTAGLHAHCSRGCEVLLFPVRPQHRRRALISKTANFRIDTFISDKNSLLTKWHADEAKVVSSQKPLVRQPQRFSKRRLYVCLSKIKSGHIRGAIRRGVGGKEYALPSSRGDIPKV